MSSYSSHHYSSTVPIPGSTKAEQYAAYQQQHGHHRHGGYTSGDGSAYSASPEESDRYYVDYEDDAAERDASVTSHGGYSSGYGGYATTTDDSNSYDYSSGYGASYYDADGNLTSASASGVDFNEYIQDRFADGFDPIPLDRSLATQAQASGALNGKHRELLDLQAQAQARLARSRARFQQGMRDAHEVRADLEWTSKKVGSLKKKAEKKHSKDYKKARERYPSPEY